MRYSDRLDAGHRLAKALLPLAGPDVVVVGLPRGGVPVASEVATALSAPLDVILVRKLGAPFQPEYAMGAIGEDGVRVMNEDAAGLGVSDRANAAVEERERAELAARTRRYRAVRQRVPLTGKTVIVVDDGVATGSTARAACRVARAHGAARVVLAVPIGPPGVESAMRPDADEVVCIWQPADFRAVGQGYEDFSQTEEQEVTQLLHRAADAEQP